MSQHVIDKAREDDLALVSDTTDPTAAHLMQALLHESEHMFHETSVYQSYPRS